MKIAIAAPHEVDAVWPMVSAGFLKACKRSGEGDVTPGYLWQLCRSGNAYLLLVWDDAEIRMASVWQFRTSDDEPVFHNMMMFGTGMRDWARQAHQWINDLAKDNGAVWLTWSGRRGWLRFMKAVERGDDMALKVT